MNDGEDDDEDDVDDINDIGQKFSAAECKAITKAILSLLRVSNLYTGVRYIIHTLSVQRM